MNFSKFLSPLRRAVDYSVAGLGGMLGADRLPMYFHDCWIWMARPAWNSIHSNYEPYLANSIRSHLPAGSTFFDVGAHYGLWAQFAARVVGKSGAVWAFEPSAAFEVLATNVRTCSQIHALNVAIGESVGTATFFGQGESTSGSMVQDVTEINRTYLPDVPIAPRQIQVRSLDSIAEETGIQPGIVKVDVEGFELNVLRGARRLMQRSSPIWIIEVHPLQLKLSGGSEEDVMSLLRKFGYAVDVIDRNPNSIYTILARKSLAGTGLTRS